MEPRHQIDEITRIWSDDETKARMKDVWIKHRATCGPTDVRPPKKEDYPVTGHEIVDELVLLCLEKKDGDFHWGLTSSDVVDTVRMSQLRDSLAYVQHELGILYNTLRAWAMVADGIECVGYTHQLPAERVSMKERFMVIVEQIEYAQRNVPELVWKPLAGPTGMKRFPDSEVKMGTRQDYCGQTTNGQTYFRVACWLADVSRILYKLAQDMRFLISTGEIKHAGKVVGSSSMPHKANPTLWERVCSLAMRQPSFVHEIWLATATSVLERTLTDSALLRNALPEMLHNAARQIEDASKAISKYEINKKTVAAKLDECPHSYEELLELSKEMPRIDAYFKLK